MTEGIPCYLHCHEICNLPLAGIPPHEVAKVAGIKRTQLATYLACCQTPVR